MKKSLGDWGIFIALSVIWGSSFILIKWGLEGLTSYQVASLRIVAAGLVLLPVTVKHIRSIPSSKMGYVFLSGVLGSLAPSFLFCIAEEGIDSALAGTLNALTPIFTIIAGAVLFSNKIPSNKVVGIVIAFVGCVLLLFSKGIRDSQNIIDSSYVIIATLLYGINVNMVQKHLKEVGSLKTASVALSLCAIPALIILIATGYFNLNFSNEAIISSTISSVTLGMFGTALATIIFYVLIKRAGAIFSSMVTYGIPFVAIAWGIVFNEDVTWKQIACLGIILAGVYYANRNIKKVTVLPD
jgi:drug/metabolite transporter (DMT)-like permease